MILVKLSLYFDMKSELLIDLDKISEETRDDNAYKDISQSQIDGFSLNICHFKL